MNDAAWSRSTSGFDASTQQDHGGSDGGKEDITQYAVETEFTSLLWAVEITTPYVVEGTCMLYGSVFNSRGRLVLAGYKYHDAPTKLRLGGAST